MGLGLPLAKEIAARHGGALTWRPLRAARNALRTGAAARMNAAPPASAASSSSTTSRKSATRSRCAVDGRRGDRGIRLGRGVLGERAARRALLRDARQPPARHQRRRTAARVWSSARTQAAVIMMTGHGDIPTAVQAMKLGAYHFVEKPFDAENLLGVVEEALSRAERDSERLRRGGAVSRTARDADRARGRGVRAAARRLRRPRPSRRGWTSPCAPPSTTAPPCCASSRRSRFRR